MGFSKTLGFSWYAKAWVSSPTAQILMSADPRHVHVHPAFDTFLAWYSVNAEACYTQHTYTNKYAVMLQQSRTQQLWSKISVITVVLQVKNSCTELPTSNLLVSIHHSRQVQDGQRILQKLSNNIKHLNYIICHAFHRANCEDVWGQHWPTCCIQH